MKTFVAGNVVVSRSRKLYKLVDQGDGTWICLYHNGVATPMREEGFALASVAESQAFENALKRRNS